MMPGFFGFISNNKSVLNNELDMYEIVDKSSDLIQEEIEIQGSGIYGKIFRNAVNKFSFDKAFYSDQKNLIAIDGVVLNKHDLCEKYDVSENEILNLIKKMSIEDSETFFRQFRGTFAGVFWDKETNKLKVFTNHIGDKEVFYYLCKESQVFYFSTDFKSLIKMVHEQTSRQFKINNNAAYSLMVHSHVLCNETLFEDVYRLTPGHYIQYSSGTIEKECYYAIDNTPISISKEEALARLDTLFRNAVKRVFEKDLEYGYKHLVALSGGLDSRMTAWVGHNMGYTNMLNYTFSQTDYLDETVPKEITDTLKSEWMFKALDNGTYLYKYFDESVKISGARSQSCTISHTLSMLSNLNLKEYGLVHTGQLGDVVIGTFYDQGRKQNFKPGFGAYSTKLLDRVQYTEEKAVHLEDQEIFKFYNRGFTGVNIGLKPMFLYTETTSPFLDVDFLDFCLSLPLEYRSGHKIYIEWINKFYPEAADFIYEKVKGKINRKTITVQGIPVPWTSVPAAAVKLIKNKLGLKLSSKKHMHPMDYWYQNNKNLRDFYEEKYNENINLLTEESLRKDCEFLFREGNTLEKDQVVTLLGFLKQMDIYIK
ncbi:hypothetical protein [Bacillus cereus]|uniref:hypothetical protein n=1 Tax=Bacillus cereus TaxID=1396 RepID=UPI00240CF236|nr:hypothetical protein [Bacillus cereus]MDG1568077.1 hypothetical protein [Bacillus cereus]